MINQMQEDKKCPVCSNSIPESFDENETPENQRYLFEFYLNYKQKNIYNIV